MVDVVEFSIRGSTAREKFANAVEDIKAEVLSRHPNLLEADAHKKAAEIVAQDAPQLLAEWKSSQN